MSDDKRKIEKLSHLITFVIWLLGAAILFGLWEWQKSLSNSVGEPIAFILQISAWLYPFALLPISFWVSDKIEKL
jgi:F0F1-type ATP synthase assembly protein I